MNDPSKFWEGSKIGAKAVSRVRQREPFNMPDLLDENGNKIFEQLGLYILQVSSEKMLKGFVELDKVWGDSNDENIIAYREEYFKTYPKPFSNRKAFLMKILLEEKKENTDAGVVTKKVISRLKPTKNERFMFTTMICAFENPKVGWTKEWDITEVTDLNPETQEIETIKKEKDGFRYLYATTFCSPEILTKVTTSVSKFLKEEPETDSIYAFFLASDITIKPKEDGNGFWISIDPDEIFFL